VLVAGLLVKSLPLDVMRWVVVVVVVYAAVMMLRAATAAPANTDTENTISSRAV
jgi:uncharacterized membrane protein YfcA